MSDTSASSLVLDGRVDGLGQLNAPLVLHLADAKKGSAHDGDDDGSQQRESSLVVKIVVAPGLRADSVENGNDGGRDNHAN